MLKLARSVVAPVQRVANVHTQLADQRKSHQRSANKKRQRKQDQVELRGQQQRQERRGLRNG